MPPASKATIIRAEAREEVKLALELAEAFHDFGMSIATRTLYMGAEEEGVETKMAERFIKNLHILETASDDVVTVIMNNPGGDDYHGMAIYDSIKLSPCKIKIVVRGHAMSMGSIILQAADERVMGPMSCQMVHYGYFGVETHALTAQKIAEESKRMNEWMENMYLHRIREKHPRFSFEKLKAMLNHDTYLTAQQSVDLGLADKIG